MQSQGSGGGKLQMALQKYWDSNERQDKSSWGGLGGVPRKK